MSFVDQTGVAYRKQTLRAAMRARLRGLPANERLVRSQALCSRLVQHPAYREAQVVAIFDALPSEPQLELLGSLSPRRFVYPRVVGLELELVEVTAIAELASVPGRWFREPSAHLPACEPTAINLILVPGLAFTRAGERLGRGGGFYDRLLARLPQETPRLGICFEDQIVLQVSSEPHDQLLQGVITDLESY